MPQSAAVPLSTAQAHERVAADFDEFFAAYADRLRGYVRRWLDVTDADDVAQETLSCAFVRWEQLDPGRDPWPWLSVVARNAAFDLLRSRRPCAELDDRLLHPIPEQWTSVPEEGALRRERDCLLQRAFGQLPERQREVLQLRAVAGLGIAEIAAMFGLNNNAARQQLYRARQSLAAAYRAAGGTFPAVGPGVLLVGLGRWLRRHLRDSSVVMTPVASMAAAALAVVAVLAPLAVTSQSDEAVQTPVHSTAVSTTAVDEATFGGAASAATAPTTALSDVGAPEQPPSPRNDAPLVEAPVLPVTPQARTSIGPNPLAPGAHTEAHLSIATDVTTLLVESQGRNGDAGPVCSSGLIDCS